MLCEYSHTKSESLAQIHTIMVEIQHFFYGIVFIGAPCREVQIYMQMSAVPKPTFIVHYFLTFNIRNIRMASEIKTAILSSSL